MKEWQLARNAPSLTYFSAAYDCAAYGAGSYDQNTTMSCDHGQNATMPLPATSSNYDVLIALALGTILLVAGMLMILRRKSRKHKTEE